MIRHSLLLLAALSLVPSLHAAPSPHPNVLIIFTDDLDFDEVGAYNPLAYPTATAQKASSQSEKSKTAAPPLTPNIDRLISESMDFTQMRMASTVCTPSRYALLTGQFCSRSLSLQKKFPTDGPACVEFNTDILPGQWDLPRALHDAGYTTGIVGKWHLTDTQRSDLVVSPPICDYTGKQNGPQDPSLPENAQRIRSAYGRAVKYLHDEMGWDYVSSIYMTNASQLGLPKPLWEHESNMEWFTAGVLKFLDQQKDTAKPFFLYFAPNIPHGGGGDKFAKVDSRATPEGLVDWHLGVQPTRQDVLRRVKEAGASNPWATWLDDGVGAILKKLADLGLAENTIVIFSSDQQSRGKWTCYEGAHVPFTVRWPAHVKAGSRCNASLSSVDVAPTLLELCDAPLPPAEQTIVDGLSFAPCLTGGTVPERPVLIEMGFGRAVVSNGWKYVAIRFPEDIAAELEQTGSKFSSLISPLRSGISRGGREAKSFPNFSDIDQLYNLKSDPLERHNLANDPESAPKLKEMKLLLTHALAPLPHVFGEFKTTSQKGSPAPIPPAPAVEQNP